MNRWMYGTALIAGVLAGAVGLEGCSGKVETGPESAQGDASQTGVLRNSPDAAQTVTLPPTPGFTTEHRYNHALKLYDEGSYAEAEQEFLMVCEAWPKFSKPFKHLARTQLKLDRFEEALENALDAAELNPKDGTIDNVIGLAYMGLDDFDSAETAFRAAIGKTPTFAWAYNNLGYLMIQKQDNARARDILLEGGKVEKAPAVLFNNLGIALEHTGDTAAAKEAFAKAVELDPGQSNASVNLSRMETQTPVETKTEEIVQVTEKQ